MTRLEKKQLVTELSHNIVKEIIADIKADNIPEAWDGIELRQLLADRFNACVFKHTLIGKRKQSYVNECMIRNL